MNPTLRSLVGARAAGAIDPSSSALLLIDFQNEYFGGALPIPDGAAAVAQAARLLALADRVGMPVFHVRHVGAAGDPLFAEGGEGVAFHPSVRPAPHHTVLSKSMISSFAGTDLHARLQRSGVRTLIIAGLMTHMCVSTAARDARQFGAASYAVLLAADACATRDLPGWDGGELGHRELHRATLTALADNFAEVLSTGAILDLPVGSSTCLS